MIGASLPGPGSSEAVPVGLMRHRGTRLQLQGKRAMADDDTEHPEPPPPEAQPVRLSARPPPPAPTEEELGPLGLLPLSMLALVVGIVGGFGAVVFRDLIGLIHNILFLGQFRVAYDSSVFTPPSPWGAGVILVPVIGSLGVTWLVSTFAPEAKGHGVPEVMDAIYYQSGIIRPVVAVVKSVASALAIGSGAAIGREGPIIQIGAAMASTLGQVIRMQPGQRITLVAAGAGAGIAATFNTPIGGVLFATELMLPEISVNTFLPVAVATGMATFIGRLFFGDAPAFRVPPLAPLPNHLATGATLLLYVVLGAAIGVAAAVFIRGLHWLEDRFDRIPERYSRHALGMLLVGLAMYGFQTGAGHYYIEGVGYATIQATLRTQITGALFLLLLFVAKLLATTTSLGSGSSGGIFSPSLFMGATIGAAFAAMLLAIDPRAPVNIPSFAMVGMGAMVGGATGAGMTAVTMIFEMTRDYVIVLPMILAVALALGIRRMLSPESIYTLKLVRRGHAIPRALHANMFLVRKAAEVMERDVLVLDEETTLDAFLKLSTRQGGLRHVVATRGQTIVGVISMDIDLRRAIDLTAPGTRLVDLMRSDFVLVGETDVNFDVINRMRRGHAAIAIVVAAATDAEPGRVLGVIAKEDLADSVASSIRIYAR